MTPALARMFRRDRFLTAWIPCAHVVVAVWLTLGTIMSIADLFAFMFDCALLSWHATLIHFGALIGVSCSLQLVMRYHIALRRRLLAETMRLAEETLDECETELERLGQ